MRLYFDENFSPHLVKGMRAIQDGRWSEGVTVTSVEEEFGRGAADEVWIPEVASRHGIALTQDLNIHRQRPVGTLQNERNRSFLFQAPKEVKIVELLGHCPTCDAALAGDQ